MCADSCLLFLSGGWRLIDCSCLVDACCLLFVVYRLVFEIWCLVFVACWLVACCLLVIGGCRSAVVVRRSVRCVRWPF